MAGIEERELFSTPAGAMDAAADVFDMIAAVCQVKDGITEGAAMGVWHVATDQADRLRKACKELIQEKLKQKTSEAA